MDISIAKELVDYGIMGVLALMGFISLWAYIERLFFYNSVKLDDYRYKEELDIALTNNISIISSVASNAPYVGLLGTVVGIIITFYLLGQSEQMDAGTIMTSLSLALKATAFGLVVAIPSMVFYNHLVRQVEVLQNRWEILQKDATKEV